MLRVLTGDIVKLKDVEAIVNAANGKGKMGFGVALGISVGIGNTVRNEIRQICENNGGYKEGECYVSNAGDLISRGIKYVYHAVTMEYPGGRTSLDIVTKAMRQTLQRAIKNDVKSIAFPGLGTGVGRLNKEQVAARMVQVAQEFCDRIDITIIDIDESLIGYAKRFVSVESKNA